MELDEIIHKGEIEQDRIVIEIHSLQETLNKKTEKLNVMKNKRDELSHKLDEALTHLKQVHITFKTSHSIVFINY